MIHREAESAERRRDVIECFPTFPHLVAKTILARIRQVPRYSSVLSLIRGGNEGTSVIWLAAFNQRSPGSREGSEIRSEDRWAWEKPLTWYLDRYMAWWACETELGWEEVFEKPSSMMIRMFGYASRNLVCL